MSNAACSDYVELAKRVVHTWASTPGSSPRGGVTRVLVKAQGYIICHFFYSPLPGELREAY